MENKKKIFVCLLVLCNALMNNTQHTDIFCSSLQYVKPENDLIKFGYEVIDEIEKHNSYFGDRYLTIYSSLINPLIKGYCDTYDTEFIKFNLLFDKLVDDRDTSLVFFNRFIHSDWDLMNKTVTNTQHIYQHIGSFFLKYVQLFNQNFQDVEILKLKTFGNFLQSMSDFSNQFDIHLSETSEEFIDRVCGNLETFQAFIPHYHDFCHAVDQNPL
ncbi:hypothetical protein RF11_06890 [Thelohanellus kitauei]|uniref:Uncharacterized protein n=1 Tax=Thelohanellus kitauei TaxID=669202 RepID=A0A0C2MJ23_THEKT|nr:hypothetical protein RF11_06890 [Thelohanellus kitauei]